MNNRGFTLMELLGSLALLGIVLIIGICATRNTLATSLTTINTISDEQVYNAATNYVVDKNVSFDGEVSVCVYVKDLIYYGYLNGSNVDDIRNKIVNVSRNNVTKVIDEVKYVDSCN